MALLSLLIVMATVAVGCDGTVPPEAATPGTTVDPAAVQTLEARVATAEADIVGLKTAVDDQRGHLDACCRGPIDPGGHVVDAVVPIETPVANSISPVRLFRVQNASPDGTTPGTGQCRRMTTRVDGASGAPPVPDGFVDWGDEPPVVPVLNPAGDPVQLSIGGVIRPVVLAPVPAVGPPNPMNTLTDTGAYGWLAALNACYFVEVRRDTTVRYSPLVGVVLGEPVTDLDHCWLMNFWGSIRNPSFASRCS